MWSGGVLTFFLWQDLGSRFNCVIMNISVVVYSVDGSKDSAFNGEDTLGSPNKLTSKYGSVYNLRMTGGPNREGASRRGRHEVSPATTSSRLVVSPKKTPGLVSCI